MLTTSTKATLINDPINLAFHINLRKRHAALSIVNNFSLCAFQGEKCDRCIPGSFGLSADYPLGCYACFCFPTSQPAQCEQLKGFRSVPEAERRLQVCAMIMIYNGKRRVVTILYAARQWPVTSRVTNH